MLPGTVPFILHSSNGGLVFGMEWFPVMGGRPGKTGQKLARRHRATHLVPPAVELGAVGLVSLKGQGVSRQTRLYSAAQNVAQLFVTGSVALLIRLQQRGYWLVAVHEGVVIARTDRIYHSQNDAREAIDSLRLAYPQLQVLDQEQDSKLPTLDALAVAGSSCSQLQPLRRWQSFMPWPVQVFVLALVMVLLLPRVFPLLQHARASEPAPQATDAGLAWRQAVTLSVHGHQVHGSKGMRALIDTFLALPTGLGGWSLQRANCALEGKRWQCRAEYERQDAKASNSSFLEAASPAWEVEFSSLDRVSVGWQPESHGLAALQLSLPSSAQVERHLLSVLQGIKPGFVLMQIGRPVPVPVKVPKDLQGKPLPRPKEQRVYATRQIRIAGPLRSASLLLSSSQAMAWQSASLTLGQAEAVGLTGSKLNLSLQGLIYEIDKAMDVGPDAAMCARLDDGGCVEP